MTTPNRVQKYRPATKSLGVCFSEQEICVREMKKLRTENAKQQSTFIELCFKYMGLPESRDATRLKTKQPEEAAMEDAAEVKSTWILFRSVWTI